MAVSVKAILGFDGRAFDAGIKKARTSLNSFAKGAMKSQVAQTLSVGFIQSQITAVSQFAKQVTSLAPALGMTTDELQKWEYVFARVGLELDDVADAFITLTDRTEDALAGTESMIEDFRLVGLSVDQLRGKNPQQIFEIFADAVSKTEDKNRALTSIVRNLGDDLGRKLAPALMMGKEGLAQMRKEAEDLGIVMGKGDIQEVAQKMVEMKVASMRLRSFMGDVAYYAGKIATAFSDGIRYLNVFNNIAGAAGAHWGYYESNYKREGRWKAFWNGMEAGNEGWRKVDEQLLDEIGKREAAFERMRNKKHSAGARSTSGINDEIEAKKAHAALQKKINDAAFKQLSNEQKVNHLFTERLKLFQKIKNAKTGKQKYELMSQDFDLAQQIHSIQSGAGGGVAASVGMRGQTQTSSQAIGAFVQRNNPLLGVAREQLRIQQNILDKAEVFLLSANDKLTPYK